MVKDFLYKNGLPFSDSLKIALDSQIRRTQKENKASMIIVDGGVGEGKTTQVVHCLDYVNKQLGFDEVEISKKSPQMGMGGKDFTSKLRQCFAEKFPCCSYDEAGDFSKRGSLTQFNAMMNRTFETFRAFKCIVFVSLPNFNVIDQQLLDNKIPRMLLHLKNRSGNHGNFFGFSLYRIDLLKHYMSKMKIKNFAFTRVDPNFYGHFLDLPPERRKLLDKVCTENKISILETSELKLDGLIGYPELSTKLNRSILWVRNAVSKLKIKPAKQISNKKYFSQDAFEKLMDHVDYMKDRRRDVT